MTPPKTTEDNDRDRPPMQYFCGDYLHKIVGSGDLNDDQPLMSLVPEPPPSHWGKITSRPREQSEEYKKFRKGKK